MEKKIGFQRSPIADIGEAVGSAGTPIILYGFNVVAEVTGTGPDIRFFNDSDGNSDIVIRANTTADVPTTVVYPEGIVFPNGCFLDVDDAGNVTQVTVFYETLK